ncbi:ProQ/FINO family protein [Enterobacter ludwigii]|uniref:ProQ/FINO family protein n=1 Tax=Enterobacter ludwigii TaxID=299767 RepID=UPI003BEF1042
MKQTVSNHETDNQAARQPLTKRQRKSKKNRRRWLERLTETWPQAFNPKAPRPLAVGIIDSIMAELNRAGAGGYGAARYAVKGYTSNIRYIRALAAGGPRYNLHGEPEGEVTAEQQQRAAETLKIMTEKNAMFADEVEA